MARQGITRKQAVFVEEYLKDLNATQAAIRAKYSPKTAESQGCQLLKNPKVVAEIEEHQKWHAAAATITSEWVLKKLQEGIEQSQQLGQFGPYAKMVELAGRHVALFSTKVEVTGKDGGPIQLTLAQLSDLAANE